MSKIFLKENNKWKSVLTSFVINTPYYITSCIASLILGYLTKEPLLGFITNIVIHIWAWIGHYLSHRFFICGCLHDYHHTPEFNNTWYAEIIEIIVNFFGSGGFGILIINMIVEYFLNIRLLNNHVILMLSFVYTSIHLYNYHVYDTPTHKHHHSNDGEDDRQTEGVNLSPEFMDIIFGTKQNNEEYENINHAVPNIVLFTSILVILFYLDLDPVPYVYTFLECLFKVF